MTMPGMKMQAPHTPTLCYALIGALLVLFVYHLAHRKR